MKFEASGTASCFVLQIAGERRRGAFKRSIFFFFLAVAVCFFLKDLARFVGMTLGCVSGIWEVARVQYGKDRLTVDEQSITLTRSVFFFRRSGVFPRSDVERLGYLPAGKETDPALGLMVRTVMMPMAFGHGIRPEEASQLFATAKESGSWIGPKIRPVGTPLF